MVATWNLWGGNAPGTYTRERGIARGALPGSPASREDDPVHAWKSRAPLLVAELARIGADVVALQENTRQPDGRSCAAELADRLGMHVCEDDHPRGLAVLSRSPVVAARRLQLGVETFDYPPPLVVELDAGSRRLTFVTLHLPLGRSGDRAPVVRELANAVGSLEPPLLVCGDLNAPPGDPVVEDLLSAGLTDASAAAGNTMPNPEPRVRLDYVLVGAGGLEVGVRGAATLGHRADPLGFLPSDHLGVVVELDL